MDNLPNVTQLESTQWSDSGSHTLFCAQYCAQCYLNQRAEEATNPTKHMVT